MPKELTLVTTLTTSAPGEHGVRPPRRPNTIVASLVLVSDATDMHGLPSKHLELARRSAEKTWLTTLRRQGHVRLYSHLTSCVLTLLAPMVYCRFTAMLDMLQLG